MSRFPTRESGVKSLAALKRLFESGVTSARLNPNERSHRAEAEAITQRRGRTDRHAIEIVVVRKSPRIEVCRDRKAQIVGQFAKATKSYVPIEGEVTLSSAARSEFDRLSL